jgi:hypothetical protein
MKSKHRWSHWTVILVAGDSSTPKLLLLLALNTSVLFQPLLRPHSLPPALLLLLLLLLLVSQASHVQEHTTGLRMGDAIGDVIANWHCHTGHSGSPLTAGIAVHHPGTI